MVSDKERTSETDQDNTNQVIAKPKFYQYCTHQEIVKLKKSSSHTGLVLQRGNYYIKTWRKEYENGQCGLDDMEIAPLQTSDDWAIYSNEDDCNNEMEYKGQKN